MFVEVVNMRMVTVAADHKCSLCREIIKEGEDAFQVSIRVWADNSTHWSRNNTS